jgi:hypothetical protein
MSYDECVGRLVRERIADNHLTALACQPCLERGQRVPLVPREHGLRSGALQAEDNRHRLAVRTVLEGV